jgi:hypothetical protein
MDRALLLGSFHASGRMEMKSGWPAQASVTVQWRRKLLSE